MSKLTANAFLAQRVSSINAISEICEKTGADVNEVARAVGMDERIGPEFLKSSVGFGGSCFQKDILNLVYIAKSFGLEEVAHYWEQVILMNEPQKKTFATNIIRSLYNTVAGKRIAILGWAFKKNTNDTRESAAICVADILLSEQAEIVVYDPQVAADQIYQDIEALGNRTRLEIQNNLKASANPYEACKDAHAVAILTEWDEFISYDWQRIYLNMIHPAFIFDGRNVLNGMEISSLGFIYKGIGTDLILKKVLEPAIAG